MSDDATNAKAPPQAPDDDGGMGTPVLSLDGFFSLEPELPERVQAEIQAREQLRAALVEEEEYWERLSSGVLHADVPDLSGVPDDFKEYARDWARYGRGLDVIGDYAAHRRLREERFQRKVAAKERKARAAEAKLSAMKRGANATEAARERQQQQAAQRAQQDAEMFAEQPAPPLPFDAAFALEVLDVMEEPLAKIHDEVVATVPELSAEDRQMCVQGFDHIIATFTTSAAMRKKYGYSRSDHTAPALVAGGDVPSYFANVSDGSIYRRKLLSLAGLRNLVLYGPTIYTQLRNVDFSGDLSQHKGDTGLSLMRRVTGNVVDLDTTVLRCTDRATLNAVNALNKHQGLPVHRDSNAFANSPQAQEIAVNCALPLLEDFAKAVKLESKAFRVARKIDPSQIKTPVPVASNNTDRGRHPVWQYVNAGQNSFHVNVPTMADVNGALLKAPLHCLRCWLQLHALYGGDAAELAKRVEDFFENCVVDACFNGKWKAIEEYVASMQREGTIVDVLQKLQMANQGIFTADFFDADDDEQSAEVREMARLAAGLNGREAKTGRVRPITSDDVRAWVLDPSVTI